MPLVGTKKFYIYDTTLEQYTGEIAQFSIPQSDKTASELNSSIHTIVGVNSGGSTRITLEKAIAIANTIDSYNFVAMLPDPYVDNSVEYDIESTSGFSQLSLLLNSYYSAGSIISNRRYRLCVSDTVFDDNYFTISNSAIQSTFVVNESSYTISTNTPVGIGFSLLPGNNVPLAKCSTFTSDNLIFEALLFVDEANNRNYTYKIVNPGELAITAFKTLYEMAETGGGYSVTYDLVDCTGSENNPTVILPQATVTLASFTPLPSFYFNELSVTIDGTGYPDGPVQFVFDLDSGNLRIGPISSAITVHVKGTRDPYSGSGASGPGGGDGTFDFSSTPINYPGLPTIGAYSTGFLNVYVPSAANLRSLAAYMWAGAFDIDNFRKLVADPMDAIMGLSIVPVTSAEIGVESTTLIVGNISTGISMPRALSQYVAVDCGTVEMPAKWGAYLDFSPYTKLQLYLPYIGFVDISPDDVMTANMGAEEQDPGTISVQYHVDILSGSCIAFVKCRDHVIYEFGGQCACSCPVTEGQYKNGLLGMLEIISTVASTASAVAGGPGERASKANREASQIGKIGAVAEGTLGVIDTSLAMIKPNITRSGSVGGSNGLMGYQIPYLVLTVPHMCIPGDQNVYIGYPSFVTLEMSELAGFTQIQITHLHNMSCTSDEADEIISLLSEGVIF